MQTLRDILSKPHQTKLAYELIQRLALLRHKALGNGQAPLILSPERVIVNEDKLEVLEGEQSQLFGYTALELFQGDPNTIRSELFSFGAILYEVISGQRAFSGKNHIAVKLAVMEGRYPPLEGVSAKLVSLCEQLLSKQKELRPESYEVVLQILPPALPLCNNTDTPQKKNETILPSKPQEEIKAPESTPSFESLASIGPFVSQPVDTSATESNSRYQVEREIGRGGRGRVSLAHDKRLRRSIAVKELLYSDQESKERFLREMLFTARLQHPSIVPLYDAGQWDSGDPYYAMKLVTGRPLNEEIEQSKTLEERLSLLPRVISACEAIAYAHKQNIIHRDLKPQNILLGEFGETLVIDWGLAKETGNREQGTGNGGNAGKGEAPVRQLDEPYRLLTEESLTVVGAIVGTPAYMPLEQAQGKPTDARADVYSLGALLYHLLAGRAPYQGRSSQHILQSLMVRPPVPLSEVQRGAPNELVAIISKAMARDASERYPSASELVEDLKRFQTGQLVRAFEYSLTERLKRFWRRYRSVLIVALLSFFVLAVVTTVSVQRIVQQQRLANQRADSLALLSARSFVELDPLKSLKILSSLSNEFQDWGQARIIAADALTKTRPTSFSNYQAPLLGEAAALSSDGRWLAYGASDFSIQLWDQREQKKLQLLGHTEEIGRIFFFDNNTRLISFDRKGSIRFWDLGALDCNEAHCGRSSLIEITQKRGGARLRGR